MAFNLGSLAPLAGLAQGMGLTPEQIRKQQESEQIRAINALRMREAQQQQQAYGLAGNALGNLGQGAPGGVPGGLPGGLPSQALGGFQPGGIPGGMPQGQMPPQGQQLPRMPGGLPGGGLGRQLPDGDDPGGVKGSWFGNYAGQNQWSDKMDSGLQAGGAPVSAGPGIALPSRATLGQEFDVTAPSGQTMRLPQTDIGPAKWTGRGVDINAPAAEAMGYTPQNFPTDKKFKVSPVIRQEVLKTGIEGLRAGMPADGVRASSEAAMTSGAELDPKQFGRYDIPTLWKAVDKANPNADPAVKFMALAQLHALMAPDDKMAMQMVTQQNRAELQIGLAQFRATEAEKRASEATTRATTIEGMREGAAMGRQQQAQAFKKEFAGDALLPDETVSTMAEQYLAGDRTVMQNLGRGAQGSQNIVKLRGEIAKKMGEQGVSGSDMATKMAEFEGLKAGERTLTQRTANIGMRVTEAKMFAPLALAASEKVDRTQFPTLNGLIMAAEKGTGDENVVRLGVATQSLLNAYAAAVTPTGTPTEGAQNRAHELLDKAWSQGQFKSAIDQLMIEMNAASKSPGIVREEFRNIGKGKAGEAPGQAAPTAPPVGAAPSAGSNLNVTEQQYNALPSGAVYTIPGDPTPRFKP